MCEDKMTAEEFKAEWGKFGRQLVEHADCIDAIDADGDLVARWYSDGTWTRW